MSTVIVVVDPNFRERLTDLPPNVPVWIVDTPTNSAVAHRLWAERQSRTHLTGITTFQADPNGSPEEILIEQLDMIDLHHGRHSANPPYSRIEAIGTPLTEKIKSEMAEYGFDRFQITLAGFEALRSPITNRA